MSSILANPASNGGVTLPRSEAEQMWEPSAPMRRATQMSFLQFMRARKTPYYRPLARGLKDRTALNYERYIIQMLRARNHPVPELHARRPLVPEESALWWEVPPTWREFYEHTGGGHPRWDAHRKAMVWYAALYGLDEATMPKFIRHKWAGRRDVYEARLAGEVHERARFLNLPADIRTLLGASPYEDWLRQGKMWHSRRLRREARYKDKMWRCLIFLQFYLGARPGEFSELKMTNVIAGRGIVDWAQIKKYGEPRDATVPEQWVIEGHPRNYPSLRWYLETVRAPVPGARENKFVFLQLNGRRYTNETIREFIALGMRRALGRYVGPHSLRRACATWRYLHGWTLDEIARLLGDSPRVIEDSYLDKGWIASQGGRKHTRSSTPEVPLLRSAGGRTVPRVRPKRGVEKKAPEGPENGDQEATG